MKLSTNARKQLAPSQFVFPASRKYPIPDKSHGINAKARVAQFGTQEQRKKVNAAVNKKFGLQLQAIKRKLP